MKNRIQSTRAADFISALVFCLALGLAREAAAIPLAYEGFQYVANQPLPTMNGGTGWAPGFWTQLSGAMFDQPPSLSYPSALPSNGDALLTTVAGTASRSFAGPFSNAGSDLWFSFEELTAIGAVPGALVDIRQPTAVLPDITVNKDSSGAITLNGIAAGLSAGVGFVDFFVVQVVQFSGGSSLVNLYLDPGAILGPPSASVVIAGPAFQAAEFDYQANAGQELDEIRVGTAVSDIAAVPEPSTFTLLAGALLPLAFARVKRRQIIR
jgi:hypothetical protein